MLYVQDMLFHKTILSVTQGLSSEDVLAQVYLLVLTNMEGWVDVSRPLCTKLVCGGKLLSHVNDLKYLGQLTTEVKLSSVLCNTVLAC